MLNHAVTVADVAGRPVAWVRESWPGEALLTVYSIEPGLVVPWIALTVGLRAAGAVRRDRAPVSAPLRAFEDAALLVARDRSAAEDELRAAGFGADVAEPLAQVLGALRCTWRASAAPIRDEHDETTTPEVRSLVVLDAGSDGLWERVAPAEPIGTDDLDPTTVLRLEPRTHGQVWRALTALLDIGSAASS